VVVRANAERPWLELSETLSMLGIILVEGSSSQQEIGGIAQGLRGIG
jgi:hypothetical protein